MALVWIDRMAVDVRGEGEAMVFVHGLGGSLNAWTPLLPAVSRQRCVRIELPGAGQSHRAYAMGDTAPGKGRLTAEGQADAVLRVCRQLGISRAHFVGHSFGTLIAQHLAAAEPALVRSLALFGALIEPSPQMRETMRARVSTARQQGLFEIAEGISNVALSASSRENLPVAVAYVRASVGAQDAEGFARNCEALAEARAARLDAIRCPVLIVNGDEDVVTPLSGARDLNARLHDARIEVLSRCGHWPMLERPVESQRFLRDFIERVR